MKPQTNNYDEIMRRLEPLLIERMKKRDWILLEDPDKYDIWKKYKFWKSDFEITLVFYLGLDQNLVVSLEMINVRQEEKMEEKINLGSSSDPRTLITNFEKEFEKLIEESLM